MLNYNNPLHIRSFSLIAIPGFILEGFKLYSVKEFRSFLGLGSDAVAGRKSAGIITITKEVRKNQPLSIPQGTRFDVALGLKFFTNAQVEISESAVFSPVTVVGESVGSRFNIPANQTWSSPVIGGISITNGLPFSGGIDATPEVFGFFPQREKGKGPNNDQLNRVLVLATAFIKSLLGQPATEDYDYSDPRLKEAVFMLAMYRLEQNTSQELQFSKPGLHSVSPQETRYFRQNVYPALMKQVGHLLAHKYKYKDIINYEKTS